MCHEFAYFLYPCISIVKCHEFVLAYFFDLGIYLVMCHEFAYFLDPCIYVVKCATSLPTFWTLVSM